MKALKATLLCAGAIHAASALAWDLDARAKLFGNAQLLPEDDLQRVSRRNPGVRGQRGLAADVPRCGRRLASARRADDAQ